MAKNFDNIKLLCFDIDGTISCDHNVIKPEIRDELIRLQSIGYKFVLNTGRSKLDVCSFMEKSNFYTDAIVLNGACIIDKNGNSYDEENIKKDSAKLTYDILKKYKVPFVCYYPDKNIEVEGEKTIKEVMLKDRKELDDDAIDFLNMFEHCPITDFKNILKIEAWSLDKNLISLIKSELLDIDNITVVSSMGFNIEITAKTVNKAKKLLEYANSLGCDKSNVLFFGDSENDKPVFDEFDNSVYVKNERQIFDFNTKFKTESCKDGGVEKFLKEHF